MSMVALGLLVIGGSVLVSLAGMLLARRWVPARVQERYKDIAGFKYAVVGVIYGVTLAFAVVATWEEFEETRVLADREGAAVEDILRLSRGFTDPGGRAIQAAALEYAHVMAKDEWPAMAAGTESAPARAAVDRLWEAVRTATAETPWEQTALEVMLTRLTELTEGRALRLLANREGTPGVVWSVLVLGGLITIGFTYFFRVENFWAQSAMTILIALVVGLNLFLIAVLDKPFAQDLLPPRAFERVLEGLAAGRAEAAHRLTRPQAEGPCGPQRVAESSFGSSLPTT